MKEHEKNRATAFADSQKRGVHVTTRKNGIPRDVIITRERTYALIEQLGRALRRLEAPTT